jgi:uncharacterized protein YndB with AHSA1/START domain
MTMQTTDMTVRRTVTVDAPIERAFEVFTDGFDRWWPRGHHIGGAPMQRAVLEAREGGRWYEIGTDGSECEWGTVLVCDPPNRIVVTWGLSGDFALETDPERYSECEARFTREADGRTRLDFEHRHIERHTNPEKLLEGVSADGGWGGLMEMYAEAAAEG